MLCTYDSSFSVQLTAQIEYTGRTSCRELQGKLKNRDVLYNCLSIIFF